MKKTIITTLALVTAFCLGYALHTAVCQQNENTSARRATGIGGIFFKCKNPKLVREWYQTHLGLNTNPYGAVFEWRQAMDSTQKGFTQWSPFTEKTTYFEPSTKDFMINYRVQDLEWLVGELQKEGVTFTDTMETVSYGKFVHILDIEGNKIELWEPNDKEYDKMGTEMGLKTNK